MILNDNTWWEKLKSMTNKSWEMMICKKNVEEQNLKNYLESESEFCKKVRD